jgi:hypothetical protein
MSRENVELISPNRIDRRTYRRYEGVRAATEHWLVLDFGRIGYRLATSVI